MTWSYTLTHLGSKHASVYSLFVSLGPEGLEHGPEVFTSDLQDGLVNMDFLTIHQKTQVTRFLGNTYAEGKVRMYHGSYTHGCVSKTELKSSIT